MGSPAQPSALPMHGWEVGPIPAGRWLWWIGLEVVAPAILPWMRWRHRLGWRGQLRVAVVQMLFRFWGMTWVIPWMRRLATDNDERRARIDVELRAELGREPTPEERRSRSEDEARRQVDALAARFGLER